MTREEILLVAKPILFNTDMVKAILDDRKTATRRVVKLPQCGYFEHEPPLGVNPPYRISDILYVRETWSFWPCWDCDIDCNGCRTFYNNLDGCFVYRTQKDRVPYDEKWRPSIHMSKEAARIFLRVTGVRLERLQDIMKEPPGPNNAIAKEGCKYGADFIAVWENTIPKKDRDKYGWNANPWVWVIEFERVEV